LLPVRPLLSAKKSQSTNSFGTQENDAVTDDNVIELGRSELSSSHFIQGLAMAAIRIECLAQLCTWAIRDERGCFTWHCSDHTNKCVVSGYRK
jgi:hypothetical protein